MFNFKKIDRWFKWTDSLVGDSRRSGQNGQGRVSNLGGTLVCVICWVELCQDRHHISLEKLTMDINIGGDRPKLYLGDGWFGSVMLVATVGKTGNCACMMVKTTFLSSPKKFLEETKKTFPRETQIKMEGTQQKVEIELVCIGYK